MDKLVFRASVNDKRLYCISFRCYKIHTRTVDGFRRNMLIYLRRNICDSKYSYSLERRIKDWCTFIQNINILYHINTVLCLKIMLEIFLFYIDITRIPLLLVFSIWRKDPDAIDNVPSQNLPNATEGKPVEMPELRTVAPFICNIFFSRNIHAISKLLRSVNYYCY